MAFVQNQVAKLMCDVKSLSEWTLLRIVSHDDWSPRGDGKRIYFCRRVSKKCNYSAGTLHHTHHVRNRSKAELPMCSNTFGSSLYFFRCLYTGIVGKVDDRQPNPLVYVFNNFIEN